MDYRNLEAVLNDEILVSIDRSRQDNGSVTLKEDSPGAKLKKIVVNGLPEATVVFKLDLDKEGFKQKSPYLDPSHKGLHGGCDYVIFTRYRKRHWFIFCELKSGSAKGGKAQIYNSIPFVKYLEALLVCHYQWEEGKLKYRYVVFKQRRLDKQPTYRPKGTSSDKDLPI